MKLSTDLRESTYINIQYIKYVHAILDSNSNSVELRLLSPNSTLCSCSMEDIVNSRQPLEVVGRIPSTETHSSVAVTSKPLGIEARILTRLSAASAIFYHVG